MDAPSRHQNPVQPISKEDVPNCYLNSAKQINQKYPTGSDNTLKDDEEMSSQYESSTSTQYKSATEPFNHKDDNNGDDTPLKVKALTAAATHPVPANNGQGCISSATTIDDDDKKSKEQADLAEQPAQADDEKEGVEPAHEQENKTDAAAPHNSADGQDGEDTDFLQSATPNSAAQSLWPSTSALRTCGAVLLAALYIL
ncbi:hypothetical protein RI367_003239 [Sorochytrium milnesiophthora]